MKAWIAIDSGGTKTHMLLTDEGRNVLAEAFCPGIGAAVDTTEDLPGYFIDKIIEMAEGYSVVKIAANLGGKNEKQLYRQLKKLFPQAIIWVFRESSGILARQLGKKYQADCVIFMGTGIIANTCGPNGMIITDGWGCNIGDAGSG